MRVDTIGDEMSGDLRADPTAAEIAARAAATEEQVLEAREAAGAYRADVAQTPRGTEDEDGDTLGDTLACTEDRASALAEDRATLERLLRALTPREREVLRLRFEEDLTQTEIGRRIGVSQMHVSRIIRQSIARLRTAAHA